MLIELSGGEGSMRGEGPGHAVVLPLGSSSELSPAGVATGCGAGEPCQPGPE